ncbi:hypothetical protein K456DRAFT_1935948, partial [Colletotrichum gloeosporioides 23]
MKQASSQRLGTYAAAAAGHGTAAAQQQFRRLFSRSKWRAAWQLHGSPAGNPLITFSVCLSLLGAVAIPFLSRTPVSEALLLLLSSRGGAGRMNRGPCEHRCVSCSCKCMPFSRHILFWAVHGLSLLPSRRLASFGQSRCRSSSQHSRQRSIGLLYWDCLSFNCLGSLTQVQFSKASFNSFAKLAQPLSAHPIWLSELQ